MDNFAKNPLGMNNRTWTLQPGDILELSAFNSTGFIVVSATADFEVSLDEQNYERVFQGFKYKCPSEQAISKMRIRNPSAGANTINLIFGIGDFEDNRLGLFSAVTIASAIPAGSTSSTGTDVVIGAGTTVTIRSSEATRQYIDIRSSVLNVGLCRAGGSTAAGNRGIGLSPGETLRFNHVALVAVFNPNPWPIVIQHIAGLS